MEGGARGTGKGRGKRTLPVTLEPLQEEEFSMEIRTQRHMMANVQSIVDAAAKVQKHLTMVVVGHQISGKKQKTLEVELKLAREDLVRACEKAESENRKNMLLVSMIRELEGKLGEVYSVFGSNWQSTMAHGGEKKPSYNELEEKLKATEEELLAKTTKLATIMSALRD